MPIDTEKITLVDFVKENTSLFSAFGIFIAASAGIKNLIPGTLGAILAICFTILAAIFLFELYNLMIEFRFKNKADVLVGLILSIIFSLLVVHLGLYFKVKSDIAFYTALWVGFFVTFFTALWLLFRFKGIKIVGRWIIFITILVLSLLFTVGTYGGYDRDIDAYTDAYYKEPSK